MVFFLEKNTIIYLPIFIYYETDHLKVEELFFVSFDSFI